MNPSRVVLAVFIMTIAYTAMPQSHGTAAFARVQPTPSSLQGTSWQLVKFQGGDGATLTPDDRAKYTIEFGAGGRLTVRIDCNRGSGTWKSSEPSRLELGRWHSPAPSARPDLYTITS